MQLYMPGRLKSICKFKEKQVADTLVKKRASATANIKALQIQQLPKKHLQRRISRQYRYISHQKRICTSNKPRMQIHQKSKSFIAPPISITIPSKKEKTMQSSELESGLPDEAEQECIVFSFLEAVANFIVGSYS